MLGPLLAALGLLLAALGPLLIALGLLLSALPYGTLTVAVSTKAAVPVCLSCFLLYPSALLTLSMHSAVGVGGIYLTAIAAGRRLTVLSMHCTKKSNR